MPPFNEGQYNSPAFNALLVDAESVSDPALRASKLAEAERILLDDQAVIPLSFSRSAYAVSPHVHGYRTLPSRTLLVDDVTVDP